MKPSFIETILTYKWQAALALAGLCFGGILVFSRPTAAEPPAFPQIQEPSSSSSPKEEAETPEKEGTEELVVDVKGAVRKPGLYTLPAHSRVNDAVQAAGGLSEAADPKSINLAQKVTDEAVIYVAAKDEGISVLPAATSASPASDTSSGKALINLNTATESDLQTISGIGAKRAADIIAYRDSQGGFQSVDELNNVSGIGDKTLENIRPYVTVD